MPRKRNPNGFTAEENQTAMLLATEGWSSCVKHTTRTDKKYTFIRPTIGVSMCDRQALLPAEKVFGTKVIPNTSKRIHCPPQQFPPDGKGFWVIRATGSKAAKVMKRLEPILTEPTKTKWRKTLQKCPE